MKRNISPKSDEGRDTLMVCPRLASLRCLVFFRNCIL
nr:MAG TPA: hypothetical protein [Caudoviricetes sp.]